MEAALTYQKSLWKFVGILCLIMITLTILVIIALIVIAFVVAKYF